MIFDILGEIRYNSEEFQGLYASEDGTLLATGATASVFYSSLALVNGRNFPLT